MHCSGQFEKHAHSGLPLPTFNQANERAINVCRERELLLGKATLLSNCTQHFPER